MISDSLKVKIQDWIIKHPSVVASLIIKDTISVRDNIIDNNIIRVGNHLIQISNRELYDDLIKSKYKGRLSEVWKDNKQLVSDTGVCCIITINIKTCTPSYNQMW